MKLIFVLFFALVLASACDKPESKPTPEPKPPAVDTPTKITKPIIKKKALDPKMAEVHKALRANKKLIAIREHRKLYPLPLHASKQAIEMEQTKLGLPSIDRVHSLIWEGKEKEAKAHLRLVFRSLNEVTAGLKLAQMKKRVGEATQKNLDLHIKNGKLLESLKIYHYLHPDVSMPEMYKIVSGKMPKNVKY